MARFRWWLVLGALVAPSWLVKGCGGQAFDTAGTGASAGAGGSAAGDGSAGTAGSGGSSGSGGTGATAGVAGSAGVGGGCGECPELFCGPGWHPEPDPGGCCDVCVPDDPQCAPENACNPATVCGPGERLAEFLPGCCACVRSTCDGLGCPELPCDGEWYWPPGACCAVCRQRGATCGSLVECGELTCAPEFQPLSVDGVCCMGCGTVSCDQKPPAFQAWLQGMIQGLNAKRCVENSDCEIANLSNDCVQDCGTALNRADKSTLISLSREWGAENCQGCPAPIIGCTVPVPLCSNGRCIEVY